MLDKLRGSFLGLMTKGVVMNYAQHLGFEHLSSGGGAAELRAAVKPEHLNLHGTAHGGFLYSLADEAFALASNSHEASAIALNVHMDYFSVVREGDVLTATATEEHLGRRVATYRVEIKRDAEVVALFTGTVYRMDKPA